MPVDRIQVIPILLSDLSCTCVIDCFPHYKAFFSVFIKGEYQSIFSENPVALSFRNLY